MTMEPVDCGKSGHDWAPIGVYVDGKLTIPCRRKDCDCALEQLWQERRGVGTTIDGMTLDIEDDPLGGVAKVVCLEASGQYGDLGLKPGDVVLDIGAHVGIVSIYLAIRYPGIRIYAYEPVQENYRRLLRNIEANGATGITTIRKPVTGDGRTVEVSHALNVNSGGNSIYQAGPGSQILGSTTMAKIFEEHKIDRCALLKIDCEGAEYEILDAGESLLSRVDNLRGEFHTSDFTRQMGWSRDKLLALCQKHIPASRVRVSFQGG